MIVMYNEKKELSEALSAKLNLTDDDAFVTAVQTSGRPCFDAAFMIDYGMSHPLGQS